MNINLKLGFVVNTTSSYVKLIWADVSSIMKSQKGHIDLDQRCHNINGVGV